MGAVHFPEAALRTFLRVFHSDADVEEILDRLAQTAIDAGSTDELELFAFAHWELRRDERVTREMQAVVLVEEVGMPTESVATVLGMTAEQVVLAVRDAWVRDAGLVPLDEEAPPPVTAQPEPLDDDASSPVTVEPAPPEVQMVPIPPPPRDGPAIIVEPPRRRRGIKLVAALLLAGLGTLAAVALSQAGYARLAQQGIDPVLFLTVAAGFCVAGYALVRAGAKDDGPVERLVEDEVEEPGEDPGDQAEEPATAAARSDGPAGA